MTEIHRRTFCAGAVGATVASQAAGAALVNDRIRLGLIGCGGRMMGSHVPGFSRQPGCEIVTVCDVDQTRMAKAAGAVEEASGKRPARYGDLRRLIEDPGVDAVVISTPDHWHCLAAIWACQAGKDVYVEKPLSHSVSEGRALVDAVRRHQRVVQVGVQNRSGEYSRQAKEYLDSGELGAINLVRVLNQGFAPPINRTPDTPPPDGLDWDLWLGPAPARPYSKGRHYNWRSYWDYAGGDVTDDTVHQLDLACMLVGIDAPPRSVHSVGFVHEGNDAEVAGTLTTQFEFDNVALVFNQTQNTPYMAKSDPGVRNGDLFPTWLQSGTRIEIFGSKGMMLVGRHGGGWQAFGRTKDRKPVAVAGGYGRFPDDAHKTDFLDAIRSRRQPNGDAPSQHLSALLCHAANISYRAGGALLEFDADRERFVGNDAANALLAPPRRAGFELPS